jgi:hypothetical protein
MAKANYLSIEQIAFLLDQKHISMREAKDLADGKILPNRSHLVVLLHGQVGDISKVKTNQFTQSHILTLTSSEEESFKPRKELVLKRLGEQVAFARNNKYDTILFTLDDLGDFTEKEITHVLDSLTSSGFVRCQTFGYSKERLKQYKFGLPGILSDKHY